MRRSVLCVICGASWKRLRQISVQLSAVEVMYVGSVPCDDSFIKTFFYFEYVSYFEMLTYKRMQSYLVCVYAERQSFACD
jgi:hypothetical protein